MTCRNGETDRGRVSVMATSTRALAGGQPGSFEVVRSGTRKPHTEVDRPSWSAVHRRSLRASATSFGCCVRRRHCLSGEIRNFCFQQRRLLFTTLGAEMIAVAGRQRSEDVPGGGVKFNRKYLPYIGRASLREHVDDVIVYLCVGRVSPPSKFLCPNISLFAPLLQHALLVSRICRPLQEPADVDTSGRELDVSDIPRARIASGSQLPSYAAASCHPSNAWCQNVDGKMEVCHILPSPVNGGTVDEVGTLTRV